MKASCSLVALLWAGLLTVGHPQEVPEPVPTLKVGVEGLTTVVLSWPYPSAGFVVECAPTLSGSDSWSLLSSVPAFESDHYRVKAAIIGNQRFFRLRSLYPGGLPSDPTTVAPPLDQTGFTDLSSATAFLYRGPEPIQTGVTNGAIDPRRSAVLRGRVLTRDGQALAGVQITVLDHPECGGTLSRQDGHFDLAVNGGGRLVVCYRKGGFLSAQRQVQVPWQDYTSIPDVALIPSDPRGTTIALSSNAPIQVARGGTSTDADGQRQATLLFPPGVEASVLRPDGSTQALTQITVRATELTVGDRGLAAMPAALPPQVGYTYCVKLSADEASVLGATQVEFSQPIPCYVENFLNFPVGIGVPVGFYDPERAVWVPSDDGRVIRILGIEDGLAKLDLDGSGQPPTPERLLEFGLNETELETLAQLYGVGQSFWRARIPHFSWPDFNWPIGPNPEAKGPTIVLQAIALTKELQQMMPPEDSCRKVGASAIESQNQVLRERIPLTGTRIGLNYSSVRCPGRRAAYFLSFPVSSATNPPGLKRIEVEISVAGRQFKEILPPETNLTYTFQWDGLDVYGRRLQGTHPAHIRVGYAYDAYYQNRNDLIRTFGYRGNGTPFSLDPARMDFTFYQEWDASIGTFDAQGLGLGGWTLDVHHAYDPVGQRLYLGNGEIRAANHVPTIIETVAGGDDRFHDNLPATQTSLGAKGPGIVMDDNGNIYLADSFYARIRCIDTNGIIRTVAGGGSADPGDGGLATNARLYHPFGLALGRNGSLYFSDRSAHRIRKVSAEGILSTIAGTGTGGFSGDGNLATTAQLNHPQGIAVAPDGNLYLADYSNHRIRQVSPDGVIQTVAGTGISGFSGDGGSALDAKLLYPATVAVGPDGSFYFSSWHNNRIRRVGADGLIHTVAGGGRASLADGLLATAVNFAPDNVAVSLDGNLVVAARTPPMLFRVEFDGTIQTIAGTGVFGFSGDAGPALQAQLAWPIGCAFDSFGNLYLLANDRIRRVGKPLPQFGFGDIAVASEDGREVYQFTPNGRHRRTLSTLTGAVLFEFRYDSTGRLAEIDDQLGNLLQVQRDAVGTPQSIITPFGHSANLQLDDHGNLQTVREPLGRSYHLTYTNGGLLSSFTDPAGRTSAYHYDSLGRLQRTEDAAGGFNDLERADEASAYTVTLNSAEGVAQVYRVEKLASSETRLLNILTCCGATNEVLIRGDGTRRVHFADQTMFQTVPGPDPRFGMQSPHERWRDLVFPSGLAQVLNAQYSVTLRNPADYFSLELLTVTNQVNGREWSENYFASNRTWIARSPEGREITSAVDERGRLVELRRTRLTPLTLHYDARGRVQRIVQGSQHTGFAYDLGAGFLSAWTNALQQVTRYRHDALGHITNVVLPNDAVWHFTRDSAGQLGRIIEPGGTNQHEFTWTPVRRLESYRSPLGKLDWFEYDRDRRLTNHVLPTGEQVLWSYNTRDQLVKLVLPQGAHSFEYANAGGQLIRSISADGQRIEYTYDGPLLTRAAWSDMSQGMVDYQYNPDLRLSHIRYGGRDFNLTYDNDGFLAGLHTLVLERDPQNGLTTALSDGAWRIEFGHDPRGALNLAAASHSNSALCTVSCVRDELGRMASRSETIGGATHAWHYAYDAVGRLVTVQRDGVPVESYAYDAVGNRVGVTNHLRGISLQAYDFVYDADQRLVRAGNVTFEYDASGRLLRKAESGLSTSYHYRADGALVGVDLPDGRSITYRYDVQHRRVAKLVNGVVTHRWLYGSGLAPLADYDGGGNLRTVYLYPGSALPAMFIRDGVTYHVVKPEISSTLLIVDPNGVVVKRMDYDSFGTVLSDSNSTFSFPFGFVGGLADADTGLIHFGVRDYNPGIGRWTAKDPLLFAGVTHLYAYAENDPVNRVDHNGMAVEQGADGWASAFQMSRGSGDTGAIPAGCEFSPFKLAKGTIEGDTNIKSNAGGGGVKNLLPEGMPERVALKKIRREVNTAGEPMPVTGAENYAPSAALLLSTEESELPGGRATPDANPQPYGGGVGG